MKLTDFCITART